MDIKKVIKDIEQSNWWTEECPGHLGFIMVVSDAFTGMRNHIGLPYHTISLFLFEKGMMREQTKANEKSEAFLWILERMKTDSAFVDGLMEKQRAFENNLVKIFKEIDKTDLKEIKDEKLWQLYGKFFQAYVKFVEVAAIPECGDTIAENYLLPLLKDKEKVKEGEINEVMMVFSTPIMYSFMEKEHLDFLKLCVIYLENRVNGLFERMLKEHVLDYFWIKNNYHGAHYLDEEYYIRRVKEETEGKNMADIENEIKAIHKGKAELKRKKEEFSRTYGLGEDARLSFVMYEKMGVMIDERKRRMLISIHYIEKFHREISRRFSIRWPYMNYYDVPEIKNLLLDKKRLSDELTESRFECSAYIAQGKESVIAVGDDAKRIIEAFNSKISMGIVKGIVANRAQDKVIGEVCVIMDPHNENFTPGKILVTTMTRPDFIHLIKKAKAIITDEGGITSHAAIVSREFNIPCIIGTKNGTRMLKTGDRVEIDTEKGIVRKI